MTQGAKVNGGKGGRGFDPVTGHANLNIAGPFSPRAAKGIHHALLKEKMCGFTGFNETPLGRKCR